MRKSLLALMRGPDGRSLARALIGLLTVTLFAAGVHTGAMATNSSFGTLCSIALSRGEGIPPQPADQTSPCCTIGCPAPAIAEMPTPPALPAAIRQWVPLTFMLPVSVAHVAPPRRDGQPRGPPSFV